MSEQYTRWNCNDCKEHESADIPIIHGKAELEEHDKKVRADEREKVIDEVLITLSHYDDIFSVIPTSDMQGIVCVIEQLKSVK